MPDEVVCAIGINLDQHRISASGVCDDIVNVALNRCRGDIMFDIIRMLLFPATIGFADCALHASGHAVGI